MSLKGKMLGAIRSASNRGLRQLFAIFVLGYSLLLVGVVFVKFDGEVTETRLTTTFELKPEQEVPELSPEMGVEQGMIDRIQANEAPFPADWSVFPNHLGGPPAIPDRLDKTDSPAFLWHGFPVLYAYPMAHIHQTWGNRGLSVFNVICTLLTMCLVRHIGIRIWNAKAARENTSGPPILAEITGSQSETRDPAAKDPLTISVTANLFGFIAMSIFALNPIVFSEATRPSPRPFAYLLSTVALCLALRVTAGDSMPRIRCFLFALASGLVHLPALLVAVPVMVIAWFGGEKPRLKSLSRMQRLGATSRRAVWGVAVAAILPLATQFLSSFSVQSASDFVNGYLPLAMHAGVNSAFNYCTNVEAMIGSLLVNYAPQLAMLSIIPLPDLRGTVERAMLIYGVSLLAFFSLVIPGGDFAEMYPVLVPTAILGAAAVVNIVNSYVEDAMVEVAKLWGRFFAVLATMPVIGTMIVWVSSVPVEEMKLYGKHFGPNGVFTSQGVLTAGVAVLGLMWLFLRRPKKA